MKVEAFIPCFIDQFYPETAENFIALLEKAGCEVNYNPEQTCCGQPAFNSGYWKEARKVADTFLELYGSSDCIVTPSASCSGFVKNYYKMLFEEQPDKKDPVERVSESIVEFSDFLVNHLGVKDFGASFKHKVTFHDSCAGLREYGIKDEPRELLANVHGLDLIEMEDLETCCGFGGTFAAKFHNISTAMTEQKVEKALKTGAEYIVSTEASCLMSMDGYIRKQGLPIGVVHLVDVLSNA